MLKSEVVLFLYPMENQGEIILYQPDNEVKLEVRLENETVWLNRGQLAELFARDVKTIGKHVNNALKEELAGMATVANFATVQKEGDRIVTRQVEYYNLDMVLSVGYRVKSNRGIEFRRWANRVLKEYLLKGYSVNRRLTELEHTVAEHSRKIDFFVRTSLPPVEGIFYDGQLFDAYKFATDLIRSAKISLLLIDNYVDESVLLMLSKRNAGVKADISRHLHTSRQPPTAIRHTEAQQPISPDRHPHLQELPRPLPDYRRHGRLSYRCLAERPRQKDVRLLQIRDTRYGYHRFAVRLLKKLLHYSACPLRTPARGRRLYFFQSVMICHCFRLARSLTRLGSGKFLCKSEEKYGFAHGFRKKWYLCEKCRTDGTVGFHKDVFVGKHSYGCERQPSSYPHIPQRRQALAF